MDRLRTVLPTLIGVTLAAGAVAVLRTELRLVTWHGLAADVANVPGARLTLALLLTAANYAVLTGYDFLAFAYLGKDLPWRRIVMTSLLAFAVSNNVGLAMVAGASVRYRFYARWGVTAEELSRIVFSYLVTFWLGLLLIGGIRLARNPLGWVLMSACIGYLAACALRLPPIRLFRLQLPLPSARLAAAQLATSVVQWVSAAAVLQVLLPSGTVPFPALLSAFLAAHLVGIASHVPGGVGVFEGLMVLLLKPFISSAALLPVLIVYRAIYYLLPLSIAAVALVADELHHRRSQGPTKTSRSVSSTRNTSRAVRWR